MDCWRPSSQELDWAGSPGWGKVGERLNKTNQFLSSISESLEEISELMGNRVLRDCLSQSLCYYDNYSNNEGAQTHNR